MLVSSWSLVLSGGLPRGLHLAPGGRIKGERRVRAGRGPSHLCVTSHLQALSCTCCHEVWPNTIRFTPALVMPGA